METSQWNPALQYLEEHHPVTAQAVERVPEGSRAILLVNEVTEPGEPVPAQRDADQPPRVARHDRDEQARDHQPGAEEVRQPAAAIGVLAEIVGIELAKAGKTRLHGGAVLLRPFPSAGSRETAPPPTAAIRAPG